jgi:hypothetical protein
MGVYNPPPATPPTPRPPTWRFIFDGILLMSLQLANQKWGALVPWYVILILFLLGCAPLIYDLIRLEKFIKARGTISEYINAHKVSTALIAFIIFGMLWSFYLVFRSFSQPRIIQSAVQAAPSSSPPQTAPPTAPSPAPQPNVPQASPSSPKPPRSNKPVPVAPGGTSVGGDVDQSGDGCQIKSVGGNNNNLTNTCAPTLPVITPSKEEIAKKEMAKRDDLSGSIVINYESSAENGDAIATQLQSILAAANINARIEGSGMYLIPGYPSYPGISFGYVEGNKNLADAIDHALMKSKITSAPLKPANRPDYPNPMPLHIVIRKP